MENPKIEGFRTYRHKENPIEKELHDEIIKDFRNKFHQIGLPHDEKCKTDREEKIIISTIQWIGTPVGQSLLNKIGFYYDSDMHYSDD